MRIPTVVLKEVFKETGLGEFLFELTNSIPIPIGLLCLAFIGIGVPGYWIFKISRFYSEKDRTPSNLDLYIRKYSDSWLSALIFIPVGFASIRGAMYLETIYEASINLIAIIWIPLVIILSWWQLFATDDDQLNAGSKKLISPNEENMVEDLLNEALLEQVKQNPDSEGSKAILKVLKMREQEKKKSQ